jgi:hydroxymethylpyrimidine kinase/phosphomethylpyrimidine kinase
MVATTGAQLLPEDAVQTLIAELLPITTLLTPNLPEAKLLLKCANESVPDLRTVNDIVKLTRAIQSLGPEYVLVKGGHLPLTKDRLFSSENASKDMVLNVLYGQGETVLFETPYIDSKNTHGTGCSLAGKSARPWNRSANLSSLPNA